MQRSLPQPEVMGSGWSGCSMLRGMRDPGWFPQSCPLSLEEEREGGELHPPSLSLEMGVIWAGLRTFPDRLFPG